MCLGFKRQSIVNFDSSINKKSNSTWKYPTLLRKELLLIQKNIAFVYKTGYNNGGLPVISQILEKYYKIPIATTSAIINITVVLIGGVFFGWTNVMYAIILIYLNTIIINKVLLGISNNKAFYIITSEEKEIKDYIIKTLDHSVTIFDVKGGFLNKKNKVVLTVVPTREYYRVTEGIKAIDKDAFFVVTDAYEVMGGE